MCGGNSDARCSLSGVALKGNLKETSFEFRRRDTPRIGGAPYIDDFVVAGISRSAAALRLEASCCSLCLSTEVTPTAPTELQYHGQLDVSWGPSHEGRNRPFQIQSRQGMPV